MQLIMMIMMTSKQSLETVGKILGSLGGGGLCCSKSGLLINFDERDAAEKNLNLKINLFLKL